MHRVRGLSTAKVVGGTLLLLAGLFGAAPAFGSPSASVAHTVTKAPGKISCSFSATVAFSPPLTKSGGGTHRSTLTRGKVTKCSASSSSVKIVSGALGGSFSRSPLACKTDTLTGASPSLGIVWRGDFNGKAATFSNTLVTGTKSAGSFTGAATVELNKPAKTPPGCSAKGGLTTLVMSGTLALGLPPRSPGWWKPTGDLPWQWEIDHPLSLSSSTDMGTGDTLPGGGAAPDPVVYDIDAILNPASTVKALHERGDHVICYMEVGSAGEYGGAYNTYYDELQSAGDLGGTVTGYPERFININAPSAVTIVESIIKDQCAAKGFNGVETDLDETYTGGDGTTGFNETEGDEEAYMTKLANYMHGLGLAWIIKNPDDVGDASYADAMFPLADGVLTEQCNEYDSCGFLSKYQGVKAIFNAEYDSSLYPGFCTYDNAHDINGVLYDQNLDGATRGPCAGPGKPNA